ncbi:MAG: hypothetical protein ACK4K9_06090 [Bacteroidia bacterium]
MIIPVNKNSTLKEISEAFKNRYSHLKIEFFIDKNHDGNSTADEMIKNQNLPFSNLAKTTQEFEFEIHGNQTISELESYFKIHFGIVVQVFHKRGNNWIMSTTTDKLTLNQLNDKAIEDNMPLNEEKPIDAADRLELE